MFFFLRCGAMMSPQRSFFVDLVRSIVLLFNRGLVVFGGMKFFAKLS